MMVSDSGNEFILEINTVPGLTPTSLLPKIADAAGKVLAWDIAVERGVGGEKTVTLRRLPPELKTGTALDYSTPVERNEGNSNAGHEYGTHLGEEEKDAIVEFMKTL